MQRKAGHVGTYTNTLYCSLPDVKAALGYDQSNTCDDQWLEQLLPQAQATIENEIGHHFQKTLTPISRNYDGNGKNTLFLGSTVSISQVIEVANTGFYSLNGTYVLTNPPTRDITADCVLGPYDADTGYFIRRKSREGFSLGVQNYTIAAVFGYASVPLDIQRACIRLVIHWAKMRDTNYADSIDPQGAALQHYSKSIPADVVQILDNYRKRAFRSR